MNNDFTRVQSSRVLYYVVTNNIINNNIRDAAEINLRIKKSLAMVAILFIFIKPFSK